MSGRAPVVDVSIEHAAAGKQCLPFPFPYGVQFTFAKVEVVAAISRWLTEQQLRLVNAIDDAIVGNAVSGQSSERGHEINGGEDGVACASSRDAIRPPRNAGNSEPALIGRTFGFTKWTRRTPRDLSVVLSPQTFLGITPRTVVRREDDQRVVTQVQFVDRVEQPAGFEIQLFNGVSVKSTH